MTKYVSRAESAQSFQSIVSQTVAAAEPGTTHQVLRLPGQIGQQDIKVGQRAVSFMQFEPTAESGIQGLDFTPPAAVQISRSQEHGQTIFGYNAAERVIERAEMVGEMGLFKLKRPLDWVESAALVEFVSNPVLAVRALAVAMRQTPNEVAERRRIKTIIAEENTKQIKAAEEIRRNQQRAWEDASHIIIG